MTPDDPSRRQSESGAYVRQIEGYRAFIPAELSPIPPVGSDSLIRAMLSRADLSLGRLDGSIHTLPNPEFFLAMYVKREAVLSSQIEGTQSSLHDVLSAEAKILRADGPKDVKDVFNYIDAMQHGLQRLSSLPVSVRLIREIHARLLQDVGGSHLTPGDLRRTQNWIGPAGCTLTDASFVPPPPHEVPRLLSNLETFLHRSDDIPLLLKVGMAHAQFETIHPFLDGNGRVGRLLITFLLCERKVLLKPVLYLSWYFKKYRTEYYERLQAIRDSGDWNGWLTFFLKAVDEVSRQATETARRIMALREEHRQRVTQSMGRAAANGHRLLENLYQRPIMQVSDVRKLNNTTQPAADMLVRRFVDAGILTEMTGQRRNRRFAYQPYIRLFQDD
jgi:Fic family protein